MIFSTLQKMSFSRFRLMTHGIDISSVLIAMVTMSHFSESSPHSKSAPILAAQNCNITEAHLLGYILRDYTRQARPILNASLPVVVKVGLRLFGIREFVEQQNKLVLDGYFTMNWYDEVLRWRNVTPYNCIDSLVFDAEQIWHPDIKLLTGEILGSPNFPTKGEKIVASSNNGSMYFYLMGEFSTRCELDVRAFPFDEQSCQFIVESWSYPKAMQTLLFIDPPFAIITNFWNEHELWEIVGNSTKIINPIYVNDDGIYDRAVFTFFLRRKSLYYYIHVIIPSMIITIAELVTFVLPVEEYLKVHISFTCLLAYSVFEDMIISEMPKSSKTIPLLSLYIDLQMAYIGVIALLGEGVVCIIIRQANSRRDGPPPWLFEVFEAVGKTIFFDFDLDFISTFLKWKKKRLWQSSDSGISYKSNGLNHLSAFNSAENSMEVKYPKVKVLSPSSPGSNDNQRAATSSEPQQSSSLPQHSAVQLSGRERWIYIAEVVERCNMWLYVAAITITPAIMFNLKPTTPLSDSH